MARSAGPSGYMANYYRWLGSPESPVGWYYEILRLFAEVSTASPWMRLPTLACGILAWLIISREVVPRLGRLARTWHRPSCRRLVQHVLQLPEHTPMQADAAGQWLWLHQDVS